MTLRARAFPVTGVLLALAAGIAVGAGPLNTSADSRLGRKVDSLGDANSSLADEVDRLQAQTEASSALVDAVAGRAVAGKLHGRRVLVLRLPGATDSTVAGLRTTLRQAGATSTGVVSVTRAWVAPQSKGVLNTLASRLVSPGVRLPDGTAYDRAATVLAAALLTRTWATPATSASTATLAALREAKLVSYSGGTPDKANLAVLVAGPPTGAPAGAHGGDPAPLTALTAAADAAGDGAVVLGPASAAGPDGVLRAVRVDRDLSKAVSTVDTGDSPEGRVATVYALAEQRAGRSGQYGVVGRTDGSMPGAAQTG